MLRIRSIQIRAQLWSGKRTNFHCNFSFLWNIFEFFKSGDKHCSHSSSCWLDGDFHATDSFRSGLQLGDSNTWMLWWFMPCHCSSGVFMLCFSNGCPAGRWTFAPDFSLLQALIFFFQTCPVFSSIHSLHQLRSAHLLLLKKNILPPMCSGWFMVVFSHKQCSALESRSSIFLESASSSVLITGILVAFLSWLFSKKTICIEYINSGCHVNSSCHLDFESLQLWIKPAKHNTNLS